MLRTLGAYDLEEELGRGGMGRVLRARHKPTGALRAIKLLEGAAANAELVERFRRESELLARVGAGVVRVHEVGTERGVSWYVMDVLDGGSLRDRLRARGSLPWREAAAIVAELAHTLARCHAAGVVHRDVKPENVLFDGEGRALVTDFGLARDLSARALTVTGTSVGTAGYAAPEQVDAKTVTAAADVFALGVILHELVTGARPFEGRAAHEVMVKALRGEREPLGAFVEVPPDLERLTARVLSPEVARRPSAAVLARSLEQVMAGEALERERIAARGALRAALAVAAVLVAGVIVAVVVAHFGPVAPPPPGPPVSQTPPAVPEPSRLPRGAPVEASALVAASGARLDELVHAALAGTVAGPDAVAAVDSVLARHGTADTRLLAVRERLARRRVASALEVLEGAPEPAARDIRAALAAGARLAAEFDSSTGNEVALAFNSALRKVLADPRLTAAAPGLLAPLDPVARTVFRSYVAVTVRGEDLLRRLALALASVPHETPGAAVAVLELSTLSGDRPLAPVLAAGRAGLALIEDDPVLGWGLVERAVKGLLWRGDPPWTDLVGWLFAVERHELRALEAATGTDDEGWFREARRRLWASHADVARAWLPLGAPREVEVASVLGALAVRKRAIDAGDGKAALADDWFELGALAVELGDGALANDAGERCSSTNVFAAELVRRRGDCRTANSLAELAAGLDSRSLSASLAIRAKSRMELDETDIARDHIERLAAMPKRRELIRLDLSALQRDLAAAEKR